MTDRPDSPAEYGIGGRLNWLIGGAIGGVVGSLLFGGLLWIVDPDIVTEAIPEIYGLDPAATAGWTFHVIHGLVLGVIFGFVVTREAILGILTADVATGFIAAMGLGLRLALVGVAYGLAVWAILPVLGQTVWLTGGEMGDPAFPVTAYESLLGHMLYGLLLGSLFSLFVETAPKAGEAESPFEEAADSRE